MKVTNRLRIVCVATLACLAASTAFGRQPGGSTRNPIKRTSQVAADEAESESASAPPEPIEQPDLQDSVLADAADGTNPWTDVPSEGGEQCDACGGDCGGSCSRGCLGGLWYGSVDYLLFRPRFSQAVAAVNRVETTDTSVTPNVSTLTDTVVEYPFDYQSGFRVAAGYRLLNCGGDFQVAYWRMTNDAQYSNGPAGDENDPFIAGNLENNPGDGEFLNASTGVAANIFDVDFAKCISMGGPSCSSGDGCDACNACFCPRWDLRFFAGARIADISRYNNNVVVTDEGDGVSFGNINARFVGAGPRVGILGRRYFGQCGLWSLYAKASQALLIGDYRMGRTLTGPLEEDPSITSITNQFNHFQRMVPVTDIEVGGTWQMAPFTFISVGYFFQCWWDLGQGENIQGTNFGALDSANILGFDGLFVRGEMLF